MTTPVFRASVPFDSVQSLPGELEAKFAVLKQQIPLEGSALRNSQNQFVLLLLPVEFID